MSLGLERHQDPFPSKDGGPTLDPFSSPNDGAGEKDLGKYFLPDSGHQATSSSGQM